MCTPIQCWYSWYSSMLDHHWYIASSSITVLLFCFVLFLFLFLFWLFGCRCDYSYDFFLNLIWFCSLFGSFVISLTNVAMFFFFYYITTIIVIILFIIYYYYYCEYYYYWYYYYYFLLLLSTFLSYCYDDGYGSIINTHSLTQWFFYNSNYSCCHSFLLIVWNDWTAVFFPHLHCHCL